MSTNDNLQLLCSYEAKVAPKIFEKLDKSLKNCEVNDGQEAYVCELPGRASNRKQITIFTDNPWPSIHKHVDVYVVKNRFRTDKLCTLTAANSSFQWSRTTSSKEEMKLLTSDKVTLRAVVTLKADADDTELAKDSPPNTPATTKLKGSPDMKTLNENTPLVETDLNISPVAPKVSKKRTRGEMDATTPNPKSRRQRVAMRALSTNLTPPSKLASKLAQEDEKLESSSSHKRLGAESPLVVKTSSSGKPTRCVDLSGRVPKPSNRWGHTMCHVSSELAVLIGGQGDKSLSKDSIWFLHPEMRTWKCPEVTTEGIRPEYRIGHTATYDPTMRCIYVYGGSKNAKWFHDVHMFDLDEQKWSLVKAEGKAPTRAYHSATLHRHELWVFGGVFPRPDPQPDGCDNEVHIFSPIMQSWYKPIVMGEKPRSRSGHSANLINDMLVVFGGWDFPYCYNDLFVLDLTTVEWSEPKCFGKPPKPRSWHASSTLTDSRIFIHGGYDGDNALHDAHVFDYYTKTWQELVVDNAPSARAGHTCLRLHSDYEKEDEDEVIVFGGGDNDGSYFSDMLSFYVPHEPKFVDVTE